MAVGSSQCHTSRLTEDFHSHDWGHKLFFFLTSHGGIKKRESKPLSLARPGSRHIHDREERDWLIIRMSWAPPGGWGRMMDGSLRKETSSVFMLKSAGSVGSGFCPTTACATASINPAHQPQWKPTDLSCSPGFELWALGGCLITMEVLHPVPQGSSLEGAHGINA